MPRQQIYLTVVATAKVLGVSRQLVQHLVQRGVLRGEPSLIPGTRVKIRYLIPVEDTLEYARRRGYLLKAGANLMALTQEDPWLRSSLQKYLIQGGYNGEKGLGNLHRTRNTN